MIYQKLQSGKQVGTDKRIDKSGVFYWYSYAVQKVDDYYVVYECEIAEDICGVFYWYSYAVQKVDDETGSLVWAVLSKWKGIYHFSTYYASLKNVI